MLPVNPHNPSCSILGAIDGGMISGWKIGTLVHTRECSTSGGTGSSHHESSRKTIRWRLLEDSDVPKYGQSFCIILIYLSGVSEVKYGGGTLAPRVRLSGSSLKAEGRTESVSGFPHCRRWFSK